ncbi:hypothetical protein RchiOBHm_Chr2g0116091 [Rosa chinensis]|uniref:Knottin, scorpion toxin n=1 Tax=Rosa chinensis TaxID=74649 RepID=A0A2P6RR93_ROSCH|nr:hypothetical protein RchiOBHm_Chr2g0116091 [Rosa chinensis]
MKFLGGILVFSIILLSLSQAESHFVKPWHLCKAKEVTDPSTPCTPLECSGLCGSLYTGGLGICIAEACECLHSCFKEGPPSRDTKPADDKTPKTVWSSPSSKDLKPDQISKMALSSSKEHLNPERLSEAALSSSKDHLKPERISKVALSSSKDLKRDRISKVALSSSTDLKHQISQVASSSSKDQLKPDRISKYRPSSLNLALLRSPHEPVNKSSMLE